MARDPTRYAIQLCATQASGSPKVLKSTNQPVKFSLEEIIMIAKARLETARVPGTEIGANIDLVRVVEVDSEDRPTKHVVFQVTLAELN